MTKEQAIILASILLFVSLWSTIKLIFELIDNIVSYIDKKANPHQDWIRNSPYTTIVNECILYTNDILYRKGIKFFPTSKIYYYKHKKYFGVFDDEVKIYTKNHNNVIELVDTVLHETCHFVQSLTDSDYKDYQTYTKQHGAWDNPFEVEAREFAEENLSGCLLYLEEKGLVIWG